MTPKPYSSVDYDFTRALSIARRSRFLMSRRRHEMRAYDVLPNSRLAALLEDLDLYVLLVKAAADEKLVPEVRARFEEKYRRAA